MNLFTNGVGRPSNETIKKRNRLKIICVILILLIIGLLVYILYDKGVIKINDNNNENKVTETEKEETNNKNITEEEIKKLLSDTFYIETPIISNSFDNHIALYFVNKERYDMNSDAFKLEVAIGHLKSESIKYSCEELFNNKSLIDLFPEFKEYDLRCEEGYPQYSYEKVNIEYKKLFGKNTNAPKINSNLYYPAYVYVNDKKVYAALSYDWGDGGYPIVSGIKSYEEKNNKLEVIYGYAPVYDEQNLFLNDGSKIPVPDDYYEKQSYIMKEYFEKYKDKLTDFKLTFEYEGDHYVYKSVERLN